ncbi:hypothetical protein DIPPA_04601 [Diplonema papillatum]|nr:hypothetical protein DIPPA_04601 [Diplonema papillatum]
MAAGLGQVPVAIVGDLNTTIEESASLRDACRNGWTDAAAAAASKSAQEPPPTCWAGAAGTRIDLCFLNECASQALVDARTADPQQYDIPTHCPLFVTLDMRTAATPKRTHWIPAPFPRKAPLKNPEEEKGALEAALRQKRAVGGAEAILRNASAVEAIEGSQREAVAALKRQRTRRWKDRVQRAWNSTDRGDVYRFLAGSQESPSIFLRRQDGTLTACPKEIDEMLRGPEAWGGIFQRYTRTEEPQWEAFKAHYARYLPAPQQMECKKIGAADVRAALKKMKKTTSPGLHASVRRSGSATGDDSKADHV